VIHEQDNLNKVWDSRAILKRDWEDQREVLEADGWQRNPHQPPDHSLRPTDVVYLRRLWQEGGA
jgi:hypothetical protein